ncbi:MAG TPA: hypothetical protein VFC52_07970 [Solirubrobacterales bacterium]|nr:hypothetical protein [Solirubrobacterales bacterium]
MIGLFTQVSGEPGAPHGGGPGRFSGLQDLYVDETGRIDSACVRLDFAPVAIGAGDSIGLGLRFNFGDANTPGVEIGRGSLIVSGLAFSLRA